MKQNKTYLHLGVTLVVSACAVLMFYDTFFQSRVLLDFFDKLMSVLSPVIYGLVFAYLLAPIVDFFDRYVQKGLPKVKSSLVRGLSILVTWICVIALIYLMFSILIPELVDSTKTLADNFESYYKTVYNWVNSLVENQTIFSDDIYSDQLLSALNGYYDKFVKWVTDTVIPQAQVAIVAVTGGIWSVVIFLKNLLIGMMISVYLLARKESFAKQSKKILYAILPETPYRRTLRAVAEAPHLREPYLELAERFYEEENWDGVVFLCREALKITVRPRTYICEASSWGSMPWDLLSLGLYYTGRFAEALDAAETAARISPSDERLAANVHLIKNRLEE